MEVFLDTTDRKIEKVALKDKEISKSYKTSKLHRSAFALLKAKIKDPKEITDVCFNKGPGSFTGLRIGAAITNALRYSLGLSGPRDVLTPGYGKEPVPK